jgi:hypothetical protein
LERTTTVRQPGVTKEGTREAMAHGPPWELGGKGREGGRVSAQSPHASYAYGGTVRWSLLAGMCPP